MTKCWLNTLLFFFHCHSFVVHGILWSNWVHTFLRLDHGSNPESCSTCTFKTGERQSCTKLEAAIYNLPQEKYNLIIGASVTKCCCLDSNVCYVLVERSARLELSGYDSVVWHVALEACASSTLWEQMDWWYMDGTGLRGRGRCPRRTRCSGGICMFRSLGLDWHENSDLRSKSATGTT